MVILMEQNKIIIKRKKKSSLTKQEQFMTNFEEWASYWRANPQRFITFTVYVIPVDVDGTLSSEMVQVNDDLPETTVHSLVKLVKLFQLLSYNFT